LFPPSGHLSNEGGTVKVRSLEPMIVPDIKVLVLAQNPLRTKHVNSRTGQVVLSWVRFRIKEVEKNHGGFSEFGELGGRIGLRWTGPNPSK